MKTDGYARTSLAVIAAALCALVVHSLVSTWLPMASAPAEAQTKCPSRSQLDWPAGVRVVGTVTAGPGGQSLLVLEADQGVWFVNADMFVRSVASGYGANCIYHFVARSRSPLTPPLP